MAFVPATRKKVKARLAIGGMSKSGKSLTSLAILRGIVGPAGRIAAIDTEHGALSLYAGRFPGTKQPGGFDVQEIEHFSPDKYIGAIDDAVKAGYDALLIDSCSHEWMGAGGILEMVDGATDKFFTGWKAATPKHNAFVRALVASPLHVVVTLRQKAEYVIGQDANGKNAPQKVGMQLVQREGFEYEFNAVGIIDLNHTLRFQWSAIDFLPNGTVVPAFEPTMEGALDLGGAIGAWLNQGDEEWTPPTFKKAFYVSGKEYLTSGIERETFVEALNLGTALDKLCKRGTAKALISATTGKANLADLTKEEAATLIEALRQAVATAEEAARVLKQA
jgi:hypothetical protein